MLISIVAGLIYIPINSVKGFFKQEKLIFNEIFHFAQYVQNITSVCHQCKLYEGNILHSVFFITRL
jgi:hypothetical protein